tara:strand:+ start:4282 stop:5832 length:1551 start_codon:yes stop_codon:yes gene_type:complete
MPISSNRRQRVIEFATPKVADLVVVERVDASKNVSSADAADETAYGTPHPDTTRFPDFKLALIKNGDNDQGQFQDWYYIKDRANQDEYNWEFQAAGASSPRFDTVVRTYVLPRKLGSGNGGETHFDEALPALNTSMPTTTNDPFGVNNFSTSGTDDKYILFEKKQVRSGDEVLDSLFVVEQRVFVKRVTIRSIDADQQFSGRADLGGSSPTKPYGGLISKETLFYKDQQVVATVDFLDNDGGTDSPGVDNTTYPVNGADSENGIAEYVFSDAEAYYTGIATPAVAGDYGDAGQKHPFWGVDTYGIMREGKQLSDNWYALFERMVVITDSNGKVSEYFTYKDMGWPAVFGEIITQQWPRRNGTSQLITYPTFLREAYSGPTKMKIEQFWRREPFDAPAGTTGDAGSNIQLANVKPMEPMAMFFTTPMFNIKVPRCLHNEYTFLYTTGTDDAEWEYISYNATWPATNWTNWPDYLVISDDQQPFRGGYLRTKVTAYSPDTGVSLSLDNFGDNDIPEEE